MRLKLQAPAIVLIEMDDITLELYQRELSKSFTVFGFTEISEVLETMANRDIQAVVIEPEIHAGKGWELIRTIHTAFPERLIPVIVCSTRDTSNTGPAKQVARYLTKPVLPKTLREITLEVVERKSELQKSG